MILQRPGVLLDRRRRQTVLKLFDISWDVNRLDVAKLIKAIAFTPAPEFLCGMRISLARVRITNPCRNKFNQPHNVPYAERQSGFMTPESALHPKKSRGHKVSWDERQREFHGGLSPAREKGSERTR